MGIMYVRNEDLNGDLHRDLDRAGKPGRLIEFNPTKKIFSNPDESSTEAYISGRFG